MLGLKLRPVLHACAIISLSSLPGTNNEASRFSSLLGLAPGGGYLAARITANAGGLLHHLFTLTPALPEGGGEAVCFCGPVRQISPSRGFPGAVPCGVRTFLDLSLSLGISPSLTLETATARPA